MLTRLYSPSSRKNREDGFTLIELLIVVIIIGILAAIALPIFLNQQKAANDGSVVSDVRNTVDSVQTFLVQNSGTAYASTSAYTTAGGKATISAGNTVGVNVLASGDYQVCGYRTSQDGNQYKSATAAYTYSSANGTFGTGACASGSDAGGTGGGSQAGGASNPLGGGVNNSTYTATAETGDPTNSMWSTTNGTPIGLNTTKANTGSASYAFGFSAADTTNNQNYLLDSASKSAYIQFTPSPTATRTNTYYKVSYYYYLADNTGGSGEAIYTEAYVTSGGSTTPQLSNATGVTGAWTRNYFYVSMPAGSSLAYVRIGPNINNGGSTGGKFYVDDLTLTPVPNTSS